MENYFPGEVIKIPKGLKLLAGGKIPSWVADAKVKIPTLIENWVRLEKKIPTDIPNHFIVEQLTNQDQDLLDRIWKGLPHYVNVSQTEFEQTHLKLFKESKERPVWTLGVFYENSRIAYLDRRAEVVQAQIANITALIRAGQMEALDENLVPTREGLSFTTMLRVDVAREYLNSIGFELVEVAIDEYLKANGSEPLTPQNEEVITRQSPIPTGHVAHAFARLNGWDEDKWKTHLGSPPKWLQSCIAIPAHKPSPAHWDPVKIGLALVRKKVPAKSVRARFQTVHMLKPWLERWDEAEDDLNFQASDEDI